MTMRTDNASSKEDVKDYSWLVARYDQAKNRRANWERIWQECYDYALPQRGDFSGFASQGRFLENRLFDATAMDCVDQLAASLLGHLTPPWTQWFGFRAGPHLSAEEAAALSPVLEESARTIQRHFDHSNFTVELHQCFLDLVVGGTAALYFEETDPGSFSAFKFSAVPLSDLFLEEGGQGTLDGSFRQIRLTLEQIQHRYEGCELPFDVLRSGERDPQLRFAVVECVLPSAGGGCSYVALLMDNQNPFVLAEGAFPVSPCIAFRWMKSPGEMYGRSPVMKTLPDIKTANKVVELILKNASIAVTGIWQADDDGVLNPATIELVPGAIIPKAVGSEGLRPLEMPGRFDVSQLVLNDLRGRIRHALLTDRLGQLDGHRMSATEIVERASEMALLLGATYGRLQSELLTPLIRRAYGILRRRGEIPDIALDGRYVTLDYRSPLARAQAQKNVQTVLQWVDSVKSIGPQAGGIVDWNRTARFIGETLSVPSDLINEEGKNVFL